MMLASFEDQLAALQKQVNALVPTKEQQRQATKAGAEVFAKKLAEVTKAKHYSRKKDEKYGHMADNVGFVDKNADNQIDGSSTVGWNNKYHAMNAMRLNNGTVHIKADHFVDQARQDYAADVFEAERKALEEKK